MPQTVAPVDRRERYREFMKRCDPVAPAINAIRDRLVCELPGPPIHRKLAARADLSPGCQQLVVGGIGSGKTTQLLLAKQVLQGSAKTLPIYVDVARETHIRAIGSGALLASVGLALQREMGAEKEPEGAFKMLARIAYTRQEWVDVGDDDDVPSEPGYWRTVEGRLAPPQPELEAVVQTLAGVLDEVVTGLRAKGKEIIVIADGLDRLLNLERFWTVAEQDLNALKRLSISVILAGPLSVLYGQGRDLVDYFEEIYHLTPHAANTADMEFLMEVLVKRGVDDMIQPGDLTRICIHSGGILRDLISLARSAAENAYIDDEDFVRAKHVDQALDQLGSNYLLGLGSDQRRNLVNLMRGRGAAAPPNADTVELLVTRRLIEGPRGGYEVHPALARLLEQKDQ